MASFLQSAFQWIISKSNSCLYVKVSIEIQDIKNHVFTLPALELKSIITTVLESRRFLRMVDIDIIHYFLSLKVGQALFRQKQKKSTYIGECT